MPGERSAGDVRQAARVGHQQQRRADLLCSLAEHRIKDRCRRGLDRHVSASHNGARSDERMRASSARGEFEGRLNAAIDAVDALLVQHFAPHAGPKQPQRGCLTVRICAGAARSEAPMQLRSAGGSSQADAGQLRRPSLWPTQSAASPHNHAAMDFTTLAATDPAAGARAVAYRTPGVDAAFAQALRSKRLVLLVAPAGSARPRRRRRRSRGDAAQRHHAWGGAFDEDDDALRLFCHARRRARTLRPAVAPCPRGAGRQLAEQKARRVARRGRAGQRGWPAATRHVA